ncbi:hypothetical protein RND81_04G028300 [Saponaria officinalis]|uniref:Uncharacterized protein n=1 Tax=Saponaria officinalis TaxID=3572 RepID=A0AAW1LI24_SAPOF
MADNKRRSNSRANSNGKMTRHKKGKNIAGKTKSTGPRLPAALRKQLGVIRNPNLDSDDDFDDVVYGGDDIDSDEGENVNDFFEYEEEVAEEESKKNRRYDPVDNFEYQLPEKFKGASLAEYLDDGDTNIDEKNSADELKVQDPG